MQEEQLFLPKLQVDKMTGTKIIKVLRLLHQPAGGSTDPGAIQVGSDLTNKKHLALS
jgi:hypothetical protein